jgi:hypothetical protein
LFKLLNAKLRGHYNYYGVNGNYASLMQYYRGVIRIFMKFLNLRSQRRSYNWAGFQQLTEQFEIEKPRIVGRPKRYRKTGMEPGLA